MATDLHGRLRELLGGLARERRTITYRELAQRAEVPPPHSIHKLTLTLEDLVREDHAAGRPLLAALAVSRGGAGLPGRGFFELLQSLGRHQGDWDGPSAAATHAAELARIWDRGPEGDSGDGGSEP